jgi:hypothetical protein
MWLLLRAHQRCSGKPTQDYKDLYFKYTKGVRSYHGYVATATAALPQPCSMPRLLVTRPHGLYLAHVVRRHSTSRRSVTLGLAVCLVMLSRHLTHRPAMRAAATWPRSRNGSTSTTLCATTTSPPPRVWVPRLIARLITRLVVLLVVDYSTSRGLVVDYFASTARLGASARRVARHAARRTAHRRLLRLARARRRLLRLHRAFGCLGLSHGS